MPCTIMRCAKCQATSPRSSRDGRLLLAQELNKEQDEEEDNGGGSNGGDDRSQSSEAADLDDYINTLQHEDDTDAVNK